METRLEDALATIENLKSDIEKRDKALVIARSRNVAYEDKIEELEAENAKLKESCCDYQGEQLQAFKAANQTLKDKLERAREAFKIAKSIMYRNSVYPNDMVEFDNALKTLEELSK